MASRAGSSDRRQRLLDVGIEALNEARLADVSAAELAARAGVAHGLLFHYFGSKEGFRAAVVQRQFELVRHTFAANNEPDPAKWLRLDLASLVQSFDEHPRMAALNVRGGVDATDDLIALVDELQEWLVARYCDRLGCRVRPAIRLALVSFLNGSMGATRAWLSDRQLDRETLIELLVESFIGHVDAAVRVDPELDVDPSRFR